MIYWQELSISCIGSSQLSVRYIFFLMVNDDKHIYRLHTWPGGSLHLIFPDELCPARPALPGPLHPDPHHPGGLVQGRPGQHVGRGQQGDHVIPIVVLSYV